MLVLSTLIHPTVSGFFFLSSSKLTLIKGVFIKSQYGFSLAISSCLIISIFCSSILIQTIIFQATYSFVHQVYFQYVGFA